MGIRNALKKLRIRLLSLLLVSALLAGCEGNVGIGMSVGIPVGSHGYVSVGGNRWL